MKKITKSIKYTTLIIITILMCSCAQKILEPKVPVQPDQSEILFKNAEGYFNTGKYYQALKLFNKYLERYPNGFRTQNVLLKKGIAYTAIDNIRKAKNAYEKLIKKYPNSPFISDAISGMLALSYMDGEYKAVIKDAEILLSQVHLQELKIKIIIAKGDAQMASNLFLEAFFSYIDAYKICEKKGKKSKDEEKNIYDKILSAINKLDQKQIVSLVGKMENEKIIGDLLFQLGTIYLAIGENEMAEETFTQFVDSNYPSLEKINKAEKQIEILQDIQQNSVFTIGCLLPLSGKYKVVGSEALKGIETAMAYFSSIEDAPVFKIIIKDTMADPEIAKNCVSQLAQEGVSIIIGPMAMVAAETAAVQAQEEQIPLIALTRKESVCEIGNFIFNNFLTPQMQVQTLAYYAFTKLNVNRLAILYPDEKYGVTFKNLFWNEVISLGGEIVGLEEYKAGATDFADSVKKIVGLYYTMPKYLEKIEEVNEKDAFLEGETNEELSDKEKFAETVPDEEKPGEQSDKKNSDGEPESIVDFQAVFIPDSAAMVGLMLPQLRFFDIENVYLLGTNIWHSKSLIERAGRYTQGAILVEGFFAESTRPVVQEFVENFKNLYGEKPGFIEAVAYDTAMILLNLFSDNKNLSKDNISERLQHVSQFNGVTGVTSFDKLGCANKELYLLTVKGNKFVEITQ